MKLILLALLVSCSNHEKKVEKSCTYSCKNHKGPDDMKNLHGDTFCFCNDGYVELIEDVVE